MAERNWPNGREENAIYQILLRSTDGKSVLRTFKDTGSLNKKSRSLLSRIIIKEEKEVAFNGVVLNGQPQQIEQFLMSRDRFQQLANGIVELFPGENSSTYYYSGYKKGDKKLNPGGALLDHLEYTKKKLRVAGLLKPSNRIPINPLPNVNTQICNDDSQRLQWLSCNIAPFTEVLEHWEATFIARNVLLKQQHLLIHEYYEKIRFLQTNEGSSLFISDFNRLQPDSAQKFKNSWPVVRPYLIQKLRECKKIKNIDDRANILLLSTLLPQHQDAILFSLIPYLVDGVRRRKRNAENNLIEADGFNITDERKKCFVLHAQTAADVLPEIERLKERLREARLTLQPLPILVGHLARISQAFVAVNGCLYAAESALDAFDLCFKIFVALDCAYCELSAPFWLFIQKAFYNIDYIGDVCNRNLHALIGEVKTYIESNQAGPR